MKYPFRVYQTQVEDHVFWIAESSCLKGCVGQGDSIEEAIKELEENETVWLETAQECGIDRPSVPKESINEYSGKFTVRVSTLVHKDAVEHAKKSNVSLNQYVNDAIVAQNARMETVGYLAPQIKDTVDTFKSLLFDSLPTSSSGWANISYANPFIHLKRTSHFTSSENKSRVIPAGSMC